MTIENNPITNANSTNDGYTIFATANTSEAETIEKEARKRAKIFAFIEYLNSDGEPIKTIISVDSLKELNADLSKLDGVEVIKIIKGHELEFQTVNTIEFI